MLIIDNRVTLNQNVYFEGLYLASSSMASAMSNLLPAVTFVITLAVGYSFLTIYFDELYCYCCNSI